MYFDLLKAKELLESIPKEEERNLTICETLQDARVETNESNDPLLTLQSRLPFSPEEAWVASASRDWPHHSGSDVFPVPAPNRKGHDAACECYTESTYLWEGEYGELRKSLARWLLKKIKEQINEIKAELEGKS